jgi:hypothetical protein
MLLYQVVKLVKISKYARRVEINNSKKKTFVEICHPDL